MKALGTLILFTLICATGWADEPGWFPFAPTSDALVSSSISLRRLNESFAGEHGRIVARDGQFVHDRTGQPVRFWAVNGPPEDLKGGSLRQCARLLAAYGVNLVRVHGPMFDKDGEVDLARVRHAQEIVRAMKAEGIYTHFSIYFPLWFTPRSDLKWLTGYDGKQHPFAALQFNPQFQEHHRDWFKALLTTPDEITGKPLIDDPAVFGVEIQNEDSYFFWTFDAKNIPDAQLRILEHQFGEWLAKKYGSIAAALAAWKSPSVARDAPNEGRVGFRPLWSVFHDKSPRDQDTAAFLLDAQTEFYRSTYDYLRQLGFQGLIHCSNWATADPETLGPLEKLSYLAGDFIDRHGYFECDHKGDNAAWSIRAGHTYRDRSALRFDPVEPGKPRQFVHPVMDPQYDDKPSMISETTFTRPNRYRSEAPLYFAAYGALQDSDAIVHFAFDGANWSVKPRFWMQQWTVATPAMLGQFPAAALIYRRGLITSGPFVVAEVRLNRDDVRHLKGTPLPQDASFDELRLKDVPSGSEIKPGQRLDPLLHYVGRARVDFVDDAGSAKIDDLTPFIDHQRQIVKSATQELTLEYGPGLLRINSPAAQGASGNLHAGGRIELSDVTISCDLDLAHIVAVALDDQPLKTSQRILLQAMSEERATGFETEPAGAVLKITNIGHDPWQVKSLSGTVSFRRSDADRLRVTALDANGHPAGEMGAAREIRLQPSTLYYLIEPQR